jgi:hypothetical protein
MWEQKLAAKRVVQKVDWWAEKKGGGLRDEM